MSATLRDRGERALLETIRRLLPARGSVLLGPGDDAAVVARARHPLVLTIDACVEDVHFRRRWLTPRALGRRAFAVSASDIAAMGGRPLAALLAIEAPATTPADTVRGIVEGMRGAARAVGAELVGGNLTGGRALGLTVAVVGEAPWRPITRAGGQVGDRLFVTGDLGGAACGLRLLQRGRSIRGGDRAVRRWQRPTARIRAGAELARGRIAGAMIDLSDGLLIDAGRLCRASDVGARIELARVPVARTLRGLGAAAVRKLALAGGEDYELLFAVPTERLRALARTNLGCAVTEIGALVAGRGVRVVDTAGRAVTVPADTGHEHFRRA